jgi:hypothetical protein
MKKAPLKREKDRATARADIFAEGKKKKIAIEVLASVLIYFLLHW